MARLNVLRYDPQLNLKFRLKLKLFSSTPQSAEPVALWKGVLQAHSQHAGCPSIQSLQKFASLEENGFDVEDCLRLTVNTKSVS